MQIIKSFVGLEVHKAVRTSARLMRSAGSELQHATTRYWQIQFVFKFRAHPHSVVQLRAARMGVLAKCGDYGCPMPPPAP
jgi:hypothetical protein